jgi:hypothetical protein
MPLDAFDAAPLPAAERAAHLAARVRAAERALSRSVAPGEDWREAAAGEPLFDARREALRRAHALHCAARDALAEAEDPDAPLLEPLGD